MRVLKFVFTTVALAGLLVGQPLCCVLGDCCGRAPAAEARAPRGADAPCCPRCATPEKDDTAPEPAPERCRCGVKKAHLAHADAETHDPVSLLPTPVAHETVAAAPASCAALTLPLLL